ncbi:hypothetical protein K458DRAFT_140875 [Lentithecium fluviatile CBS 122367]|uniref:Uncharacterized protein n=1 Tax=Lentithecium fluviatile CBS 122367 TaxID=1168545 RepID=A0A6G1IKD5_9PLEO|nr:hypothetical protein K458DRAFT_140875 [Lentithecium fluviatile CBS 122367]
MSPHCEDRSESKPISCPHPDCSKKPPYAQRRNMTRHFTNHVSCSETCVFCSRSFSKVRQYTNHFEKCKTRNSKNINFKELSKVASKRMQFLRQKTVQELNEKSGTVQNLDNVRVGTKRKLDDAMPQSQRRGSVAEDVPNEDVPNSNSTANITTNAVLASPSVHALPQWNEHEDDHAIRASEVSTNLANTRSHMEQYAESALRAPFIDTRTLDWSHPYLMGSNGGTDSFAETMGVNMDGIDLRGSTNCNIGLTTFY